MRIQGRRAPRLPLADILRAVGAQALTILSDLSKNGVPYSEALLFTLNLFHTIPALSLSPFFSSSSDSESEQVRHLPREVVFGCRSVDFNCGQIQTCRFVANDVRKHPIAFEQVA